ncbi:MAG: thioredoxin family protein [Caldilineaceae bacterium]|nr:thioredoxin family protein [Caldilineaceae bacterium]MCB0143152.1 thioredoxin family protein [Caldilineaceae bacterium]
MLTDAIQESSPALLFTSALSFPEFIEQNEFYGELLCVCYDETRLPAKEQLQFAQFPDTLNWLVIAAEDAPDTIMVLPILQRIAEASPRLDLHIVCEDDDLTRLMALVDDADLPEDWDELDTPLLLIFDEEWQYQASWGPRPQAAEEALDQWLSQHPEYEELADSDDDAAQNTYNQLLHKLIYEMRIWYNGDLRHACAAEIADLLQSIQSESESDDEDEADNDNDDNQGKDQDNVQVRHRQAKVDSEMVEEDNDSESDRRTQENTSRDNRGGRRRSRSNNRTDGDREDGDARRQRRNSNRRRNSSNNNSSNNNRSEQSGDQPNRRRSSRRRNNRRNNAQE